MIAAWQAFRAIIVLALLALGLFLVFGMLVSLTGAEFNNYHHNTFPTLAWSVSAKEARATLWLRQLPEEQANRKLKPNMMVGQYGVSTEVTAGSPGKLTLAHRVRLPSILVLAAVLAYPLIVLFRTARRVSRWVQGLCPWCKYDLQGRAGAVCPECGRRLPRIPITAHG